MNRKILFSGLLFLATFFFGLVWVAVVPAGNEAPDEGAHTEMIYFFESEHRIPIFNREPKLLTLTFDKSQLSGAYYSMAYISPLNYLPFLSTYNSSELRYEKIDVLASRAVSSFFIGLFAVFLFLALAELSSKNLERSALTTIFFTFIPQVIFSASYINVEPIGLFISALTFYLLLKTKNQPIWWNFLFLGASFGLLALCKTNYLILIVAFLPLAIFWLFKEKSRLLNLLSLILPLLIIPSWWWWRNFQLFRDPSIMTYIRRLIKEQAPSWFSPPASQGYNMLTILFEKNFAKFSYPGFFGILGGANIFFPTFFYWIFYLILLAPMVYSVIARALRLPQGSWQSIMKDCFTGVRNDESVKRKDNLLVLWLIFVIVAYFFIFVAKNLSDFSPQGRHLFPLLIPLAWLFFLAIDKIKARWLITIVAIFPFTSSIYGLWLVIDSYYVRGAAYTMAGNSGKIAEGFVWGNLSVDNYRNLINFIFLNNTVLYSPTLVLIYFLIFLLTTTTVIIFSFRHYETA